jgi:hypothetical protein
MLRRGHHRRSPAEDRVSTNRHEHAADQQPLKNHVFEFGVGFWFFSTGSCSVAGLTLKLKSDDSAEDNRQAAMARS